MEQGDLNWRAEEACIAAWPSPRQLIADGWLLRAAGGVTRRTNSVNPLRSGRRELAAILGTAEAVYTGLGRDTVFRILSSAAEMDSPLADLGYTAEGNTLTLFNDFARLHPTTESVELTTEPPKEWLATRARLSAADEEETKVYETMLDSIMLPRAFAATRQGGAIASIAYGVVHRNLAVIESVATDPEARQRGYARQTVGKLLDWASTQGAEAACLQVVADNPAALALYRSLGFSTELYRYHYRRNRRGS